MTDPTAVAGFDADAFDAYEAAGWDARSDPYDAFWAPITVRAADAVLDAAGVRVARVGTRLLDVGCGTGRVSARAASLGALVSGIDVAPSMVAAASALVPEGSFLVGSAETLPFADAAFDAVVA